MAKPYIVLDDWSVTADIMAAVTHLDTNTLKVSTAFNHWSMLPMLINKLLRDTPMALSLMRNYGLLGQKSACVNNYFLPEHLEQAISRQILARIDVAEVPKVRLQKIYGKGLVPIHIDPTRTASLIIPSQNHDQSWTSFYSCKDPGDQLIDPARCEQTHTIEILKPTLINTKVPHSVNLGKDSRPDLPRISITAKWCDTKYEQILPKC